MDSQNFIRVWAKCPPPRPLRGPHFLITVADAAEQGLASDESNAQEPLDRNAMRDGKM